MKHDATEAVMLAGSVCGQLRALGFRVQGLGCRIRGLQFRVQVQGLGLRV